MPENSKHKRVGLILVSLVLALWQCLNTGAMASVERHDSNGYTHALNLPVSEWRDKDVPLKAVVLAIHGVTLHSGCFDQLARHLASEGYLVLATDMRGFGRWERGDFCHNAHHGVNYIRVNEDLDGLIKHIHSEYPHKRLYCLGESLGANEAIALAATHSNQIDGIVLASPCVKRYLHLSARSVFDVTRGIILPLKPVSLAPYIVRYLSDDPRATQEYCDDPLVRKKLSAYELMFSLIANNCCLKKMKDVPADMPVLVISGGKDGIYKASAIPLLLEHIGSKKKTVCLLPDKGHILLETSYVTPEVMQKLDDWLSQEPTSRHRMAYSDLWHPQMRQQ